MPSHGSADTVMESAAPRLQAASSILGKPGSEQRTLDLGPLGGSDLSDVPGFLQRPAVDDAQSAALASPSSLVSPAQRDSNWAPSNAPRAGTQAAGSPRGSLPGLGPGQQLGPYAIVRELGRGAMGTVYLARETSLNREVALKVLPQNVSADPDAVTRFQREAEAIARLEHRHIVTVYGGGYDRGYHYYAMQLVSGQDLADLIKSERSSYQKAARVIAKVAEALSYAHNFGVLHRDIKPANILIGEDGEPLLTDFGLARIEGNASLTRAGTILGTPIYMPPEQASGDTRLTRQADIYSLGATLYELATGRPPYEGRDARAILMMVLREPARDPRVVDPHLPEPLSRIIGKAMARRASERYADARALAEDLEAFLAERPVAAASVGDWAAKASGRSATAMLAVVIIALLALTSYAVVDVARSIGPSDEELARKAAALSQRAGRPTAATPHLDETLGRAIALTEDAEVRAQVLESDRDIRARMSRDGRGNLKPIPEMIEKAQKTVAEARKRYEQGDLPTSRILLQEAQTYDPFNPEAIALRARFATDDGRYAEAADLYTELLRGEELSDARRAELLLLRGQVTAELEDAAQDILAKRDFSAVEGDLSWQARLELIRMHTRRHRFELAFVLQEELLKAADDEALLSRGRLTREQLVSCLVRQAELSLKLGMEPQAARALVNRARSLDEDGDWEYEIADLTAILDELSSRDE